MTRALLLIVFAFAACAAPQRAESPMAEPTGGDAEAAPAADVGGAEPMGGEMMEDEETVQLSDEQLGLLDSLDGALRLANCNDAFGHRDAICDLSERICAIAEEHPRAASRCEDAESRCASARERVSDECD